MAIPTFPTRLAAAFAAAFAIVPNLHAQTAADPAAAAAAAQRADILQRQEQERLKRDIDAAKPADRSEPGIDTSRLQPRVDASGAGPRCHDIDVVSIDGAPGLSPQVRAEIEAKFSQRCLGVAEIETILGLITKDYIDRGFVTTRAYLPAQDLGQHRLNILVVEGRIGAVQLDDGSRIHPWNVFPPAGGLLNLRDFEQGIDQVNRLSSNNATLDIQPGATAGESTVVIHNQPTFPVHASVSADNSGTETTGRNEAGVSLSSDGVLGLNELLLATYRRAQPNDMAHKGSESKSVSAIVPFRWTTVTVSASDSEFVSMVALPSGEALQFRGKSTNESLRVDQLLYRNQIMRAGVYGNLTLKDSKNYLGGELLGVSSRKLSVLDLGGTTTTTLLGGALSLDLAYSRGLGIAGALHDAADLPGNAAHAQYGKLALNANYSHPFKIGGLDGGFTSSLNGQYAFDTLFGTEQMLIGGPFTVRGFYNNTLSGDHGVYSRNDVFLRPVLPLPGQALPLRLYAGLDLGHVTNRVAGIPDGTLSGAALGINIAWKGASVDVSATHALHEPSLFQREGTQVWVRLNVDI
jgi:hemolysin activation/secretion protein